MKKIQFSKNWNNKLNSTIFSTIRLHNPIKYRKGDIYTVELLKNNVAEKIFKAKILAIETKKLSNFSESELLLDSGISVDKTVALFSSFYPNANFQTTQLDYIILEVYEDNLFDNVG